MCSFCYVEIFFFCSTPSRTLIMKVHSILTKEFFHLFSECLVFLFKSIYVFYCTFTDFCLLNHRSISRTIQSWWIIFLMYVSNQFSVYIKQETQEWVPLHHFFLGYLPEVPILDKNCLVSRLEMYHVTLYCFRGNRRYSGSSPFHLLLAFDALVCF